MRPNAIELKECPYCGANPKLRSNFSAKHQEDFYYVQCPICYSQSGTSKDEEEAIDRWNMRSNDNLYDTLRMILERIDGKNTKQGLPF